MKFYQEITLLPDAEAGIHFLWQKVFQQVHLALVGIKNANERVSVGISFPEYEDSIENSNQQLGSKLRLFAETREELENLGIEKYLSRFCDYTHITGIRPVPIVRVKEYAVFKRWRCGEKSVERLARRRAKRHNESYENALAFYANFEKKQNPPYVQIKSLSGGRDFRLYISMTKSDKLKLGSFNCYGLSDFETGATVPCF